MGFADVWNRTLVYFGIAEEDEWDEDIDGYATEEQLERSYSSRPNVRRLAPRRRERDYDDWTDSSQDATAVQRPASRPRGLEAVPSGNVQVHLVIPTPTALRLKEHPASASVVLTLKPGTGLAPDAVQGITYIVSNSVEQLASENVAVMDDAGHVLSVPASGMAGMTSRQLEMQRSVEEYLGEKVEGLLGTMVGTGHARAQVSAQLSFDQVDRTVDSFDPEGQVLESEQKSETGSSSAETCFPAPRPCTSIARSRSSSSPRSTSSSRCSVRTSCTAAIARIRLTESSRALRGSTSPPPRACSRNSEATVWRLFFTR